MQKSGVGAGKRHQGKTFIRSERVSGMYDGRAGNLRPVRFGSTGIGTDRNGTVRYDSSLKTGGICSFRRSVCFWAGYMFFPEKNEMNGRKPSLYCMVRNRQGSHGREKVLYSKVAGKRSRTGKRSRIAGCRPGGRDMAQKRYDQCPSSPYRLKPESPVSPAATSRKVWPEGISRAIAS